MGEKETKKENVFSKLLKKEIIISLVVGLVLGLVIMFFVKGGVEGFVAGTFITEKSLYKEMKNNYTIELVLKDVDAKILNKKYKLDDDDLNELKETADGYIEQYAMYGYSEEEFLSSNGFESYDDLIDYLSLDYKRTLYFYNTLEEKLEEDAVQKYYDENAFGKVNTKHILVQTSDDMDETAAQNLANEIIEKLNNGEDFDTLAGEYVEAYEDNVISEELGNMGAFDNLDDAYVEGMRALEKGEYSKEPVKSSFGYHIIYCVDKAEKTDKMSNTDRMAIVSTLITEAEIEVENDDFYKALIQMRKDAGLKFFDKEYKEKYEEYCAEYEETEEND